MTYSITVTDDGYVKVETTDKIVYGYRVDDDTDKRHTIYIEDRNDMEDDYDLVYNELDDEERPQIFIHLPANTFVKSTLSIQQWNWYFDNITYIKRSEQMNKLLQTLKELNNNYNKLEPKFKAGDTCYVVNGFYIIESTIVEDYGESVKYKSLNKDFGHSVRFSDRVFHTKEEAIKYFKTYTSLSEDELVDAVALQYLGETGEPMVINLEQLKEYTED